MWSVRVLSGTQAGQIFDLKPGKNIFGRSSQCDIKIMSVGISKEHCEIHVYKDKAVLVDLKSSNGTFLNGVKIQNSIIKLGDKFNLFDIILDVIPTPEIRPKPVKQVSKSVSAASSGSPSGQMPAIHNPHEMSVPASMNGGVNNVALSGANALQMNPQMPQQVGFPQMQGVPSVQGLHHPMGMPSANLDIHVTANPVKEKELSFKEKTEQYIENVVMPAIYKLTVIVPFKQVLFGFVVLLVFLTTFLSVIPLSRITKESNFIEATKRAKSVARALAKQNEAALSTGQFIALDVNEALKEDGIMDALIIQQSDGSILAPTDKAGREMSRPLISKIRNEPRAFSGRADSKTIVASFPIGAPDPNTGEISVRYHSIVYYNVDSLNVDDGRILSLLLQTLVMSSVLGGIIFFLFSRLIQYPLAALNKGIDQALKDKTDRVEVLFDYPVFQEAVGNVNLLLNRVMSAPDDMGKTNQNVNRDLEFSNMVEMLNQPAIVISKELTVVALNTQFEQLAQVSRREALQQHYTSAITDMALMQNMESLISRAAQSPYERCIDQIPFSQFTCEISIQASLGTTGEVEYYFITLTQLVES